MIEDKFEGWHVTKNGIFKPFFNYIVEVFSVKVDDNMKIYLSTIDEKNKRMYFEFSSIEEAVKFAEIVVARSLNYEGINDGYEKFFEDKRKTVTRI